MMALLMLNHDGNINVEFILLALLMLNHDGTINVEP